MDEFGRQALPASTSYTSTSILFTSNRLYWKCRWKLTSHGSRVKRGLLAACLGRLVSWPWVEGLAEVVYLLCGEK